MRLYGVPPCSPFAQTRWTVPAIIPDSPRMPVKSNSSSLRSLLSASPKKRAPSREALRKEVTRSPPPSLPVQTPPTAMPRSVSGQKRRWAEQVDGEDVENRHDQDDAARLRHEIHAAANEQRCVQRQVLHRVKSLENSVPRSTRLHELTVSSSSTCSPEKILIRRTNSGRAHMPLLSQRMEASIEPSSRAGLPTMTSDIITCWTCSKPLSAKLKR